MINAIRADEVPLRENQGGMAEHTSAMTATRPTSGTSGLVHRQELRMRVAVPEAGHGGLSTAGRNCGPFAAAALYRSLARPIQRE